MIQRGSVEIFRMIQTTITPAAPDQNTERVAMFVVGFTQLIKVRKTVVIEAINSFR